jgi:PKHD-type hydroxylase
MLYHLQQVLAQEELKQLRDIAQRVSWEDGRKTAGLIAAPFKRNKEAAWDSVEGKAASELTMKALRRHPQFFNAALPASVSPPMMNRYTAGMEYGDHCDAAILGGSIPMRADLSATLFISDPADYDGGELVTDLIPAGHATKLAAGDLLLYPSTSVHHVAPVTRGERLAMIFWVQSMVRSGEQRALLFTLGQTLNELDAKLAKTPELTQLYTCYYNLVRMWVDP